MYMSGILCRLMQLSVWFSKRCSTSKFRVPFVLNSQSLRAADAPPRVCTALSPLYIFLRLEKLQLFNSLYNFARKPNTARRPDSTDKVVSRLGTMAITVHLFYVPDKSLVEFVVSAYKSHNQVLGNIRRRFGAQFSAVYTQDAKTQLDDLRTVFEGQILLVATSPYTRPQTYSPLRFKFYQGEESNYIHPSLPKKPWAVSTNEFQETSFRTNRVKELTDAEKKGHIVSIGANRPETRNTLRISEPYAAVVAELDALKKVNAAQLNATYSLSMSYNEWELRMVASVAILAKATPGQGHILKDIIKDVVGSQGALTEQHVVRTITRIYERAGLISRPG
jgi:hypothetical protein